MSERCPGGDLDHAGSSDRTQDSCQYRLLGDEALSAATDEYGELGKWLDVLDERRPALHAPFRRSQRCACRLRVLSAQIRAQSRFLAGDEAIRRSSELDEYIVVPLGKCSAERCECRVCLDPDRDDRARGTSDLGRDYDSVEHEVRAAHQQHLILAA